MTVIDNAVPVIDDVTRREQVRDAMKHYCKRLRGLWAASTVLNERQLRRCAQGGYRHGETRADRDHAPTGSG
jgi:hypothetical protein